MEQLNSTNGGSSPAVSPKKFPKRLSNHWALYQWSLTVLLQREHVWDKSRLSTGWFSNAQSYTFLLFEPNKIKVLH